MAARLAAEFAGATMPEKYFAILSERGLIAVEGDDSRTFLQGLISNDAHKATAQRALYSAFLTPQGKFLHDFFLAQIGDALFLDCEGPRAADLMRRLGIYKLRSKVKLADRTGDFAVAAIFGADAIATFGLPSEPGAAKPLGNGVAFVDPRLVGGGVRAILPKADARTVLEGFGLSEASAEAYDRHRILLGLADGSRDMEVEKAILLENGFDELQGVDWKKGCFMGQELTARTKYRALIRKRLVPVSIEGPAPAPGTPLMLDGKEAGEMRSARDGVGLALVRIEAWPEGEKTGRPLIADAATVTPRKPDWAAF